MSSPANFSKKLAISECAAFASLVGLVDDCRLVGIFDRVTVDAVVRGVELAL
jgi:hypothetical protein